VDFANENGGKVSITVIVSHFLAPQLDEPRTFVEAEVPLDELTAASWDTSTKLTICDSQSVAERATG
jgi:hypothetical protein